MNERANTRVSMAAAFGCALLFQACALPVYKLPPGEPTSQLKVLHNASVSLCVDGTMYSLRKPPKQDHYVIPADRRIVLASFAYYAEYAVSYSCYPRVGFRPQAGATYFSDLNIVSDICLLEVVRENENQRTGIETEASIGPAICGLAGR